MCFLIFDVFRVYQQDERSNNTSSFFFLSFLLSTMNNGFDEHIYIYILIDTSPFGVDVVSRLFLFSSCTRSFYFNLFFCHVLSAYIYETLKRSAYKRHNQGMNDLLIDSNGIMLVRMFKVIK
jgi:hypothetical protein